MSWNPSGLQYGFGGFGATITAQVDARSIGGDQFYDVELPSNWYSMTVQQQEQWLEASDLDDAIAQLVEDQLSAGPGPGNVQTGGGGAHNNTSFSDQLSQYAKKNPILFYGGLGLLVLLLVGGGAAGGRYTR